MPTTEPSNAADRYVVLRGGLVLPLTPLLLLLDLEARGVTVHRDADDLVIRPAAQLTDEDKAAIRRWKPQLRALVVYVDSEPEQ